MEEGVYFLKKLGVDKGMILSLLTTDKLGSFVRSDIPADIWAGGWQSTEL